MNTKKNKNILLDSKINYLFILSFFIILSIAIIKLPSLSTQTEVYAEAGTNFFANAYTNDVWTNLTAHDAGYLPLFQRIISLIVLKVFGITKNFPYVVQFISLFFIAFFSSIINLRSFRSLIESDAIRFIAGITIGLYPSYEVFTFVNYGYFGASFILFMMYYDKENLKLSIYIPILILNFLLFVVKPHFLVFVPFYIFLLIYSITKKQIKNIMYYASGIISAILQYITLKSNSNSVWKVNMDSTPEIFKMLFSFSTKAFYYYVHHYVTIFFKYFVIIYNALGASEIVVFACIFFIFAFVLYLLIKTYRDKKIQIFYFAMLCNILAFGGILLAVISVAYLPNPDWGTFVFIVFKRHFVFSFIFIYLGLVALIHNSLKNKKIQFAMIIYISFQFTAFGLALKDQFHPKRVSYSQWEIYKNLLDYPDYYIPVNPCYSWAISKDAYEIDYMQNSMKNKLLGINIRSMTVETNQQYDRKMVIKAFDEFGNVIGQADQITPVGYRYRYLLFEKKVAPFKIDVQIDPKDYSSELKYEKSRISTAIEKKLESSDMRSFSSNMIYFFANEFDLIEVWNEQPNPYFNIKFFGSQEYSLETEQTGNAIETTNELLGNINLTQTFTNKKNELIGISLMINPLKITNIFKINIKILDEKNNIIFIADNIDVRLLSKDGFYDIYFKDAFNSSGKKFKLVVNSSDEIKENPIGLYLTDQYPPDTELSINNNEIKNRSLVYKLNYRKNKQI
ncbi:MAG: hypothetical protein HY934_06335 [Candidatus Firestonebacteria bacterium]|nr:hypothetical protein [Candidatus Firestonebacteria bacterium]